MRDKAKGDGSSPNPDELRAQVERTRQELGRTVEALAAKADVKAQAQQKAAKVKGLMHDKASHALHTAHDKTPEPVREKIGGRGTHTTRDLLVLAGLGAIAVAVVVVATRRSSGSSSRRWC